jgi:hypothetical protein
MAVTEVIIVFLALVTVMEEGVEEYVVMAMAKVFLEAFAGLDVGQTVVGGEGAFGKGESFPEDLASPGGMDEGV